MYLTPDPADLVDPQDLTLRIAGLLPDGIPFGRVRHLNEIYEHLPRDPQVRIEMTTVEFAPKEFNSYHFHNGTAIYLVLQGQIEIHFPDTVKYYTAGDSYIEPVGVVHRACNPHHDIPLTAVGVQITPADREAIVTVGEPPSPGAS
ncbi:cupin domain-containing protein [Pseudonocardia sp. RS010]|uniref:cupin domain-containing protein n=1 Tax=Pseudonocardia sp. RS010 TaxID=3385979 RepID=UPI00399F380A